MADDMRSLQKARPLLVVGAGMHMGGLLLYDSFPLPYLLSIPVLCCSYYLFLRGRGCRPLATPAFWGMAFVLAMPVMGLLAGIQQILVTSQGSGSRQDRLMTSLVSLLLFIPIVTLFAAMSMPAFPDAPPGLMTSICIGAAVVEAALIIIILLKKKSRVRSPNGFLR